MTNLEAALLQTRIEEMQTQVHNLRSTVYNLLDRLRVYAQEDDYDGLIREINDFQELV